jgi:hypothetical protein
MVHNPELFGKSCPSLHTFPQLILTVSNFVCSNTNPLIIFHFHFVFYEDV